MKIKTKSGFSCNLNEKKAKDWRFCRALVKCESKDESTLLEGITFVVPFLLGEDGEAKLIKHLEDKDGVASVELVMSEFKEILKQIGDAKKSQPSPSS
jgi:hypothetical protein